jgi:hypothetical protein
MREMSLSMKKRLSLASALILGGTVMAASAERRTHRVL